MKQTTIHIPYDEEKLAALNIYLAQKNLSVESELQNALAALYNRHVPTLVREFVAMRNDESPEPFVPKPRRSRSNHPAPPEVPSDGL